MTPHHTHQTLQKPNRQTLYVAIALVLGIALGEVLNLTLGGAGQHDPLLAQIVAVLNVLTDVFLRMVKMIIAPLVFATLVVGMAKMGDIHTVGRIGLKAMLWFFSASIVSLLLGMLLVNVFEPGNSLHIPLPPTDAVSGLPNVRSAATSTPAIRAAFVPIRAAMTAALPWLRKSPTSGPSIAVGCSRAAFTYSAAGCRRSTGSGPKT
jgi:hypothetical protein